MPPPLDSFGARASLSVGGRSFTIYRLAAPRPDSLGRLPFSLRVLLENLLRHEDGLTVTREDIAALAAWDAKNVGEREVSFRPSRVLMQDLTGVPAIVDLAAMRDAMLALGGDPKRINPLQPAELVIDHSVQVDEYGGRGAFRRNAELELARNRKRYALLRWGQQALANFKVVPPDTGIVHQVNLERLARVGIEAEASLLGQPSPMLIPEVVGFRLTGQLREGATATDLVLTVTEMLRKRGVVGKFVEICGPGPGGLPLPGRP